MSNSFIQFGAGLPHDGFSNDGVPVDPGSVDPGTVDPGTGGHAVADGRTTATNTNGDPSLLQQAVERAKTLAATVELLSEVDTCDSVHGAAERTVARLQDHLEARNVVVLWRYASQQEYSLIAKSHQSDHPHSSTDGTRRLNAAAEEVVARDSFTQWPPQQPDNQHALMAVAQFAHSISAHSVTAVAMTDQDEHPRGVLLVIDGSVESMQLMQVLGRSLGVKLSALEQLQPAWLESQIRNLRGWLSSHKRNTAVAVLVCLVALMLLPVRYRIGTDLELQPVKQRFVAVPFDAPLQKSHVRPGDIVAKDDLLATIIPREIEFELAGTRAELSRATQEQKRFLAEHDFASSQIAGLESEKLRLEKELLEYRRDHLEIRSPIAGVVVSGDLQRSEGMPLSRGETLFEIAPLGECIVELLIPESDFSHVRNGMEVSFHLHAYPADRLQGTVERIHPRAELRDHANVYIAELRITDPDHRLRPGMRGRARIVGDRHTLGWNLFHKAYHASCRYLGW